MTTSSIKPARLRSFGYQQLTVSSSAVGLTVPEGPVSFCLISCEDVNVRWRDDGTDPTSTVGMLLISGNELSYNGPIDSLKFISTGADAELNITYYG